MFRQVTDTKEYFTFDSIEDYIDAGCGRKTHNLIPSFVGRDFNKQADAEQACREPWVEGAEIVDSMIADLGGTVATPKSRKRRVRFDEFGGDEVDMDRLRSGGDFWRTTHRESRTAPTTIDVFADLSASAYRDAGTLLWRGAIAIVLTHKLEQAGYRVSLWSVIAGKMRLGPQNKDVVCGVQLKRPDEPLDCHGVISAVSGWFLRSIVFSAWENKVANGRSYAPAYGRPFRFTGEMLDKFSRDENRVVVEEVFSKDAAVDLMNGFIRKYQ